MTVYEVLYGRNKNKVKGFTNKNKAEAFARKVGGLLVTFRGFPKSTYRRRYLKKRKLRRR